MQENYKKRHLRSAGHIRKALEAQQHVSQQDEDATDDTLAGNHNTHQQEDVVPDATDFEVAYNSPSPVGVSENDIQQAIDQIRDLENDKEEETNQDERPPEVNWNSWMEYEMERLRADFDLDEEVLDAGGDAEVESSVDSGCWFPFKNKMVLSALRHC